MTAAEQVFRLPDLGEGLTEAEVLSWRVAVGDPVRVDEVVVEVETAKAVVEVPVPYAGTVLRLHAAAGGVVSVGEPLISVGPAADGRAGDGHEDAAAAAERYREEEQAGSGNVLIGYGTGKGPAARRRRVRPAADQPPEPRDTAPAAVPPVVPPTAAPAAALVISPVVRKLARDNGIDVSRLTPTGARGVVLRRDVEAAMQGPDTGTAPEPAATATATVTVSAATGRSVLANPFDSGTVERIPLTGIRRVVADKLSRSRTEIPDATTWVDVDATALLETKAALQAAFPDRHISLLSLLGRICVAALRRYPELNASVDTERGEIVRYPHVNLGFAAQTDRGLMVPVARGAHAMSTAQLSAELARLTGLARTGALPPEALTGGTFTLNNYGVFGVDGSTPIINHPEAALLGVGRIIDKPWVVDGALAVRKATQLSLTFDHRVCDGGAAGGFLRYVADCVERPVVLLADL
jgi:2-oxoisovalerate dehydrogenase E2 component (dihydrolipoyl transacylase)